jgi:hypothetical protein
VEHAVQVAAVHPGPTHTVADEHVVSKPALLGLHHVLKLQLAPVELPPAQNFPAGQILGVDMPVASAKNPAGAFEHVVSPVVQANVPVPHAVHAVDVPGLVPPEVEKLPPGQRPDSAAVPPLQLAVLPPPRVE